VNGASRTANHTQWKDTQWPISGVTFGILRNRSEAFLAGIPLRHLLSSGGVSSREPHSPRSGPQAADYPRHTAAAHSGAGPPLPRAGGSSFGHVSFAPPPNPFFTHPTQLCVVYQTTSLPLLSRRWSVFANCRQPFPGRGVVADNNDYQSQSSLI